jgi:ferric iron reductase protein FhuF
MIENSLEPIVQNPVWTTCTFECGNKKKCCKKFKKKGKQQCKKCPKIFV